MAHWLQFSAIKPRRYNSSTWRRAGSGLYGCVGRVCRIAAGRLIYTASASASFYSPRLIDVSPPNNNARRTRIESATTIQNTIPQPVTANKDALSLTIRYRLQRTLSDTEKAFLNISQKQDRRRLLPPPIYITSTNVLSERLKNLQIPLSEEVHKTGEMVTQNLRKFKIQAPSSSVFYFYRQNYFIKSVFVCFTRLHFSLNKMNVPSLLIRV